MLNDDVNDNAATTSESGGTASTSQPKRRRRAASRPAGPPAAVVEAAAAQSGPVESGPVESGPVESGPVETSPVQTSPVEPAAVESAPASAATEAPQKTTRRRRATKASGAPSVAVEAPAVEAPAAEAPADDAPVEEAASPAVEAPADAAEKVQKKPARRSRSRRASASVETQPDSGDEQTSAEKPIDEIASKLAAAEQEAASRPKRSRRKVAPTLASPFMSPNADTEDVLQGLAASIAGVAPVAFGVSPVMADHSAGDESAAEEVVDEAEATELDPATEADDTEADDTEADDAEADEQSDVDSSADDSSADDAGDDSDEADEAPSRRRRRRRGGRRRRRGADSDEADSESDEAESTDSSAVATDDDESGDSAESGETSDEEGSSSSRRRRRRRRRRGEDTGGADDDPSDVVVRVREPRRSRKSDEVTGIEGSTRMEAKRQRRREGRAAGRRRAPILSEAEFLARRESVERRMVIRQVEDYTQLAVLEDGILVEHYVDRKESASMIGNVYLGRVQNVLPSMEAAFIDIGRGRNAVLYAGEVDWQAHGAQGEQRKLEKVLKSGQTVLVQVSKDPVGAKGARLTSHIAIPGRYVVYSPGGHLSGISRKLSDTERNRLKGILSDLISEDSSVIVRTAAEGASEDELVRDVNRLKAQWEIIEKKVKQGSAPQLLYGEPDLTVRIVRDLFTEDFTELVVQGTGDADDVHDAIQSYVGHVAPHLAERLKRWDNAQGDIFAHYKLDQQISKALERKVFLPSGGSLVIDRTEAMTVIDVNTGRFTGTSGNLEATVTSNNLEAAEEIVRQLRLRDIGGIIVIDFIDMVLPTNRDLLIRRLVECLGRDRTRHQVAEVSSLGLVQMTRKKIGTGLAEAFTEECTHCGGRGYHRSEEPVESQAPADGGDRRGGRQASSGKGRRSRRGDGEGRSGGRSQDSSNDSAESSAESSNDSGE